MQLEQEQGNRQNPIWTDKYTTKGKDVCRFPSKRSSLATSGTVFECGLLVKLSVMYVSKSFRIFRTPKQSQGLLLVIFLKRRYN